MLQYSKLYKIVCKNITHVGLLIFFEHSKIGLNTNDNPVSFNFMA